MLQSIRIPFAARRAPQATLASKFAAWVLRVWMSQCQRAQRTGRRVPYY